MNKKHILYATLCGLSLWAITACSDDVVGQEIDKTGKTPIELTVGGVDSQEPTTRAVITTPRATMIPFVENTSLYMLMKSECVDNTHDHTSVQHSAKVTRTVMFAQPQTDNTKDYSEVNYSETSTQKNEYDKFVRYWDDSYARESALSILAICTPGMGYGVDKKAWRTGGDAAYANIGWTNINGDDQYPSIYWPIAYNAGVTDQLTCSKDKQNRDVSFIKDQDLCFSNNIGNKGGNDRRLKFDFSTKNFPKAEDKWEDNTTYKTRMIFYHALSKLTFRIKMGEGFTATQFVFPSGNNIALSNFYNYGKFKIEDGEFDNATLTSSTIEKIYQRPTLTAEETNAGYKYILDALVIPGTDLSATNASTTNAVTFILGGNEYKLSMSQLYDAFNATQQSTYFDNGKLKAGVHYVFTFTVGKTKINNITASIVDWETVTANATPKTNKISVTTATVGSNSSTATEFDLYRLPFVSNAAGIDMTIKNYDWTGRYTDKATLSGPNSNVWGTNWYFESNKHFYHFRAVSPKAASQAGTTVQTGTSPADDYLNLATHVYSSTTADSYTDVLWGAPFTGPTGESSKYSYSTTYGFDGTKAGDTTPTHQIHHGIVTTESTINLLLFHMMSDVTFNITTTTDDDKVLLQTTSGSPAVAKNTTVELIGYKSNGKVLMGNGLVDATGDASTSSAPLVLTMDTYTAESGSIAAKSIFHYGMVPQSLENAILRITTPDNNRYEVTLKDVLKTSFTNYNLANPYGADNKVNYWYPGFKYEYTFTLKKTGIDKITATILQWETVTAGDDNVTIK